MDKASWSMLGRPASSPEIEEIVAFSRYLRTRRLQHQKSPGLHIAVIPMRPIVVPFTRDMTSEIRSHAIQALYEGGNSGFVHGGYAVWSDGKTHASAERYVMLSENGWVEFCDKNFGRDENRIYEGWVDEPLKALLGLWHHMASELDAAPDLFAGISLLNAGELRLTDSQWANARISTESIIQVGVILDPGNWQKGRSDLMKRLFRSFGYQRFDE